MGENRYTHFDDVVVNNIRSDYHSVIKGIWYISANSEITDHGASTGADYEAWNLKRVISVLSSLGGEILIPPGNYTITTDLTIPENIHLKFSKGAFITGTGTLTINGSFEAGLYQIFDPAFSLLGTPKVLAIFPEWFGAKGGGTTNDAPGFQGVANCPVVSVVLTSPEYLIDDEVKINTYDKHFISQGSVVKTTGINSGPDVIFATDKTVSFEGIIFKDANCALDISDAVLQDTYINNCSFIDVRVGCYSYYSYTPGDSDYKGNFTLLNSKFDGGELGVFISNSIHNSVVVHNNSCNNFTLMSKADRSSQIKGANMHVVFMLMMNNNEDDNIGNVTEYVSADNNSIVDLVHPNYDPYTGSAISVNPEVGGIKLSVRNGFITNNNFFNCYHALYSGSRTPTDDECIYAKGLHLLVSNNSIKDSSGSEGAITLKGDLPGVEYKVYGNIINISDTHKSRASEMSAGILLASPGIHTVNNNTIINTISGVSSTGIQLHAANNTIKNMTGEGAFKYIPKQDHSADYNTSVVLKNNHCVDCTRFYRAFSGSVRPNEIVFDNNYVEYNDDLITYLETKKLIKMTSNIFIGTTGSSAGTMRPAEAGVSNHAIIVTNNIYRNTGGGYGIYVPATGDPSNVFIQGNTIDGWSRGIFIYYSPADLTINPAWPLMVIKDNAFKDCGDTLVHSGPEYVAELIIAGNSGLITSSSGVATGTSPITVNHNLIDLSDYVGPDGQGQKKRVNVTPQGLAGNWYAEITYSAVIITFDSADTQSFFWEARVFE